MKPVLYLTLLSIMIAACGEKPSVPRPKDLPASVPDNAVIKQYSNHKEGGLLEVSWDHSSMPWAEPCRSVKRAIDFARGDERVLGCPVEIDMKIRPLYLGALSIPLTKRARQQSSATTCCYTFKIFGNR